jgi:hypothetical protein
LQHPLGLVLQGADIADDILIDPTTRTNARIIAVMPAELITPELINGGRLLLS